MCTGIEIAGLIAGLAGAGLSVAGGVAERNESEANNRRMAEARNERLRATMVKNDALAQDSREAFNTRQKSATGEAIEQDRADATAKREATVQDAVTATPSVEAQVSLAGAAPDVVRTEFGKKMAEAMTAGRGQASRQAQLSGYGDSWLGQGFKDVETGRDLQQKANFASGNMSILPFQQDIAETRAYQPMSPIGGLLKGFGSMLSSYGGSAGTPKKSNYKSPWV